MKYLTRFNTQLSHLRAEKSLAHSDIAELCSVDQSVAEAWESLDEAKRCYPTLENLLDLCFKTGRALEYFIDLPDKDGQSQLELPGLALEEEADITSHLSALNKEIDRLIPAEDELELLRRYRRSDAQNKELILQLIAN